MSKIHLFYLICKDFFLLLKICCNGYFSWVFFIILRGINVLEPILNQNWKYNCNKNISKKRLDLLPQRFVLPPTGETHCIRVNGWVSGEQSINLCLHVVVRRNDVQETLDNAKVKIDAECVRRKCYPVSSHTIGNHRTNGILLVPYTGMVTAGITGQVTMVSHDSKGATCKPNL